MAEHQYGILSRLRDHTKVDLEVIVGGDIEPGFWDGDPPLETEELSEEDNSLCEELEELKEEEVEDEVVPDLDTEDWMSQLRDDEIFNAENGPAPRLHGLRRLVRPFVHSEESRVNSLQVVPREIVRALETKNGEGHVMSTSEVVGQHYFPMASVTFFVTLKDGRTFSDSADAYFPSIGGEGSKAVGLHPTAVASARAEARCLRKVLGIKEHAAEELVDRDASEELAPDDDSPIKGSQAKLIDKILGQLDMSLKELLEEITTREVFSVEELTTGEARKALKLLNDYKKKAKRKSKK